MKLINFFIQMFVKLWELFLKKICKRKVCKTCGKISIVYKGTTSNDLSDFAHFKCLNKKCPEYNGVAIRLW